MKQIEIIPIWDNGKTLNAEILNAYAVNVTLGTSATFYYSLMSDTKQTLATGNLTMSGDAYAEWTSNDDYAWDWIGGQLNLVIVGDWVEPIEPIVEPIVLTTDMKVGMGITDPSAKLEVTEPIEEVVEAPVADVEPEA